MIAGFRAYSARRLRNAGFRAVKDGRHGRGAVDAGGGCEYETVAAATVRIPTPTPTPLRTTTTGEDEDASSSSRRGAVRSDRISPRPRHSGIAPYADWIASLPRDRPVVAPEWPNISYGADVGHRYPHPGEFCGFSRTRDDGGRRARRGRALAEGEPKRGKKERMTTTPRRHTCDVIAHSYGSVVLTAFRRHQPRQRPAMRLRGPGVLPPFVRVLPAIRPRRPPRDVDGDARALVRARGGPGRAHERREPRPPRRGS